MIITMSVTIDTCPNNKVEAFCLSSGGSSG